MTKVGDYQFLLRLLLARKAEAFWRFLANCLPRKLVYFAAIRLVAHATTGEYSATVVPELRAMDALSRWSKDKWGWS